MRDSRRRVIELLRIHGSLSVGELAAQMHSTRNAAVNHLSALEREGLVARTGLRAGRRRPSITFALTEVANGVFPQGYDTFAISLLDELQSPRARDAASTIRGVGRRWIARDSPLVAACRGKERFKKAATVMAKHGFMPRLRLMDGKYVLHQYNCPIKRVGKEHPEVCVMVTRWIRALFGVQVQQLRCASEGAPFCVYAMKNAAAKSRR